MPNLDDKQIGILRQTYKNQLKNLERSFPNSTRIVTPEYAESKRYNIQIHSFQAEIHPLLERTRNFLSEDLLDLFIEEITKFFRIANQELREGKCLYLFDNDSNYSNGFCFESDLNKMHFFYDIALKENSWTLKEL